VKFIDKSKIFLKSGKGGNGCVSFRRERCVPEGGPDGGDGGKGGSIVFYVDPEKETLIDFANTTHFKAKPGENGSGARCFGKCADDLIIPIPLGTQIWDAEKKIIFFDAVKQNESFTFLQGGKGGIGNYKFKSSTNQVPLKATAGEEPKEMWVWLILKIFADVGYVGFPNAGKSSLLKILTGSKTKIANYPFTTTAPELGAMFGGEYNQKKLIMADLPGIIEGAHENKGLGLEFLGHIERCKAILHVIDVTNNCIENFQIMLNEISVFHEDLLKKDQIIALNKIDLIDEKELKDKIIEFKKATGYDVFPISCEDKKGIEALATKLFSLKNGE